MRTLEEKLIIAIKEKGDKGAASKLIEIYYKDVYRYVFKQTADRELSKDLTQEIFISILNSINSYSFEKASFKTWIYKIASNKIIDFYRSKFYKYKTIVDEIDDYSLLSSENIEEEFQIREDLNEVINIVNTMNANIQEIFRLKVFGDMSFKEISIILELSESTVKTRYYGAIKKIKNIMEEKNHE